VKGCIKLILDRINDHKRKQVAEDKKRIPLEQLKEMIEDTGKRKAFSKAIKTGGKISIIAEVKQASPSKGIIKKDFDPLDIAAAYDKSDVQAISVLTETDFFLGDKVYIPLVKENTNKPVLRKDFIIDEYQVYEAKALGADAILLIAASLTDDELVLLMNTAESLGIEVLLEVHDAEELERALRTDAEIIGINNRDLKTFVTDIKTTERLIGMIPKDRIVISESGIETKEDLDYLKGLGVDGVLIGETFMRADSIEEKVKEIRGIE
jgi:indole-3-glycerol phosphate synthase